jgi:hypothetical protein
MIGVPESPQSFWRNDRNRKTIPVSPIRLGKVARQQKRRAGRAKGATALGCFPEGALGHKIRARESNMAKHRVNAGGVSRNCALPGLHSGWQGLSVGPTRRLRLDWLQTGRRLSLSVVFSSVG